MPRSPHRRQIRYIHNRTERTSPTYRSWSSLRNRCLNPNNPSYHDYGARGITVCDRWLYGENGIHPFTLFRIDMGERPEGMSIDRIDINGPYSPENCRWATPTQQACNRRNTFRVTYRGQTLPARVWSDIVGIRNSILYARLAQLGWDVERAFTTPPRNFSRTAFQ